MANGRKKKMTKAERDNMSSGTPLKGGGKAQAREAGLIGRSAFEKAPSGRGRLISKADLSTSKEGPGRSKKNDTSTTVSPKSQRSPAKTTTATSKSNRSKLIGKPALLGKEVEVPKPTIKAANTTKKKRGRPSTKRKN